MRHHSKIKLAYFSIVALFVFSACSTRQDSLSRDESAKVISEVNELDITTPDEAIAALKQGNKRFLEKNMLNQDFIAQKLRTASGQKPYASILSCLDSRVPPEIIFDQGIGDVFVGRVAGNVDGPDMLGSFEFATELVGTKVLVVLGHTSCGAIKGACGGVELGNLTGLLDKIKPAINSADKINTHQHFAKDSPEYYNLVSEENVKQTIADIRKHSPVMAKLEKEGKLKIVGAIYNIGNGHIDWL